MRRLYRKIRRILDWLPVLWKDFEGDYAAMFEVWAYRMRREREHILKHHIIEDAQKVHDSIKVCEDALLRMARDSYFEAEFDAYHEKWPRSTEPYGAGYRMLPLPEEAYEEFRELNDKAEAERVVDENLFCHTFKDSYRTWWD